MITEEKLNQIYAKVIEENEFTTKELIEFGFNSNDITNLVNAKILTRVKRGYYTLSDVDKLFCYGKSLLGIDKEKARLYFKKCYELNPNHLGADFQLFYESITKKEYKEALGYLDRLYNNNRNDNYSADYNTYLYLLSFIIELPSNYQKLIKTLNLNDLSIKEDDERYYYKAYQNLMRKNIFDNDFPRVLKLFKEGYPKVKNLAQNLIIKKLIKEIIRIIEARKEELLSLIKEEKYQDIVDLLKGVPNAQIPSTEEYYCLILAEEILNIRKTKNIPDNQEVNTTNVLRAIDNKNYAYALYLREIYNNNVKAPCDSDLIYLMLSKIVSVIEEVKEENKEKSEVNLILEIENNLLNKEVNKALESLKIYLRAINKLEYEQLLITLIKLCLLEKDISYVISILKQLKTDNLEMNIAPLLKIFTKNIEENNFEEVELIIEIISIIEKLGLNIILTSYLSEILASQKESLKTKKSVTTAEKINVVPETPTISNPIITTPIKREIEKTPEPSIDFITKKYEELQESDGIIILKPKETSKLNIEEFNQKYKKAYAFYIGLGSDRKIVIKKIKYIPNIKEVAQKANEAYFNHDADNAIELLEMLVQTKNTPIHVYANLGKVYLAKNNIYKSLIYLEITTGLSLKTDQPRYDFTEVINKILKKPQTLQEDTEDTKVFVKMNENEFTNDLDNYYGISRLNDVSILMNYQGMSVEEACLGLNISEDDTNMIILLLARECYAINDLVTGDKYVKVVEKSSNKSLRVKTLLKDLRTNRLFYQNRVDENYKPLLLTRSLH